MLPIAWTTIMKLDIPKNPSAQLNVRPLCEGGYSTAPECCVAQLKNKLQHPTSLYEKGTLGHPPPLQDTVGYFTDTATS